MPQLFRVVEHRAQLYRNRLTGEVPLFNDGVSVSDSLTLGRPFGTLDDLGRKSEHRLVGRYHDKGAVRGTSNNLVRYRHGHDRNDNLLFRRNLLALTTDRDKLLRYDDLDRLILEVRGLLNAAGDRILEPSRKVEQSWKLDQTGNWRGFAREEFDPPPGALLDQSRRHSRSNHVTDLGAGWTRPVHDPSGNMTTMPAPNAPVPRAENLASLIA